jgi:hypothetical protein
MRLLITPLAAAALLLGCTEPGPNSPNGFRLPAGDPAAGRQAFIDLRCYVCHQVQGVDAKFEGTPAATVALGGPVSRVKSYGELVTAIINPTHKVAPDPAAPDRAATPESMMKLAGVNDVMTVTQLVNLVAFLQPQFKVVPPTYDPYTYHYHYYYH